MKLAFWHERQGDAIVFKRTPFRDIFEPEYDVVYGSSIFSWSDTLRKRLATEFPGAIIGGWGAHGDRSSDHTVERLIGLERCESVSYAAAPPSFSASIGYTQRGCRYACRWCPVPKLEGSNHEVNTIARIYRGAPWPKHIHLLDNDFFGQSAWPERIEELHLLWLLVAHSTYTQGIWRDIVADLDLLESRGSYEKFSAKLWRPDEFDFKAAQSELALAAWMARRGATITFEPPTRNGRNCDLEVAPVF